MSKETELNTDTGLPDDIIENSLPRYEYRRISSILEYRELNGLIHRFGIVSDNAYDEWKPMNGRLMMTLPASELRTIADLIDQK